MTLVTDFFSSDPVQIAIAGGALIEGFADDDVAGRTPSVAGLMSVGKFG
jgi:hypothetical protein